MVNPRVIINQLNRLTSALIASGLCDAQNFPSITRHPHGITEIGVSGKDCSVFLKSITYAQMYKTALEKELYNIKMVDGALLSLSYAFVNDQVIKHRLSYFPSPDLVTFQNEPELYEKDELYADILDCKMISVPVPVRFDYDSSVSQPVVHPSSHLTLGQYQNCRIPVSSALTPYQFVSFIVNSFYYSAISHINLPVFKEGFSESILPEEREFIHINTPIYRN